MGCNILERSENMNDFRAWRIAWIKCTFSFVQLSWATGELSYTAITAVFQPWKVVIVSCSSQVTGVRWFNNRRSWTVKAGAKKLAPTKLTMISRPFQRCLTVDACWPGFRDKMVAWYITGIACDECLQKARQRFWQGGNKNKRGSLN